MTMRLRPRLASRMRIDVLQVGADAVALGLRRPAPGSGLPRSRARRSAAADQLAGPGRQPGQAVAADADDVDLGFVRDHGNSLCVSLFQKGTGTVVRSTLRAVPATVPVPFWNRL